MVCYFSKKHKVFKGLARSSCSSLLFLHKGCGVCWQPVDWSEVPDLVSSCESCHRLLLMRSLPSPRAEPMAGLRYPAASWDMFYGDTLSMRNPEKPRSQPRKQQPTWRSRRKLQPWKAPEGRQQQPLCPRQPMTIPRGWNLASPKKTAKSLPQRKVVRPKLPGLKWEGWEGSAQGKVKVKPLRGFDWANLSPVLVVGGRQLVHATLHIPLAVPTLAGT